MSDEGSKIIICQGPPRCDLEGDEAVKAQRAGCVWCEVLTIYPDGSEHVEKPSET